MKVPFTRQRSKHDARSVANYLIVKSLDASAPLTPLHVMKLLYFSYAWMLAIFERPLFRQQFEVWTYGPVVPDVYHALKLFGNQPVTSTIRIPKAQLDPEEKSILDKVFQEYSKENAWILSSLTHMPESPWFQTRMRRGIGSTIPDSLIQEYYAKRRKGMP